MIEGLDIYIEGTGYGQQIDICKFCSERFKKQPCSEQTCPGDHSLDAIYKRLEENKKRAGG